MCQLYGQSFLKLQWRRHFVIVRFFWAIIWMNSCSVILWNYFGSGVITSYQWFFRRLFQCILNLQTLAVPTNMRVLYEWGNLFPFRNRPRSCLNLRSMSRKKCDKYMWYNSERLLSSISNAVWKTVEVGRETSTFPANLQQRPENKFPKLCFNFISCFIFERTWLL